MRISNPNSKVNLKNEQLRDYLKQLKGLSRYYRPISTDSIAERLGVEVSNLPRIPPVLPMPELPDGPLELPPIANPTQR